MAHQISALGVLKKPSEEGFGYATSKSSKGQIQLGE